VGTQVGVYTGQSFGSSNLSNHVYSVWLLLVLLLLGDSSLRAQAGNGTVEEIRTLYPSEWKVPYPAGLAYMPELDRLLLLSKETTELSRRGHSTVVLITPYEDWVATARLAFTVDDAINIAYDNAHDQVLFLNEIDTDLATVALDEDGRLALDALHFDVADLGLQDAEGMAVDPASRRLFILDSKASQVVSANLDDEFELISRIDLMHLGTPTLRGIAVHPVSHNLFVVSPPEEILYELTQSGQFVNSYDLADLELIDPRGLAFAPSADLTDAPDTIHLYMTDSNLPDERRTNKSEILWINKAHCPTSAPLIGSVLFGSRVRPAPTKTEQLFGRILEVTLDPGAGSSEPCRVHCQDGAPSRCPIPSFPSSL
jgi:hypothetical protein